MPPQWLKLAEAAALIPSGARVAVGGSMSMAPMALIREMIRRGVKELTLITVPTGGLNIDLLIGAGATARLYFAQIFLDEFGMAPNFRRAVESGALECREYP